MTKVSFQDIQIYIQDKKALYQELLEYLDPSSDNIEEKYQNLIQVITDQKIKEIKLDLLLFLKLIVKISNNFNRYSTFFDRITKILIELKETLIRTFTNQELFNIFKSNKILLLFLFKEEIITINNQIIEILQSEKYENMNYPSYFAPEIAKFNNSQVSNELFNESPSLFEENRKNGENTDEISILIRKDLIDEFITYVKQKDYDLNSTIEDSIFETNSFLYNKWPELIEYASFFGSTQIFKYLYKNGVELTSSIWIYAIHSNNAELISLLEENNIKPKDETYHECFYESIKCHHNEMASYIMNNFIKDESQLNDKKIYFKYYNFQYIECNDMNNTYLLYIACKYNYTYLVKILLETKDIDINSKIDELTSFEKRFRSVKVKTLKTALTVAIEKGSIDIVQLLLTNKNINVNTSEQYYSLEDNEKEEKDYDYDYDDDERKYKSFSGSNRPLNIAIEKGYTEIAKLLLSQPKIDVNSNHIIEDSEVDNMEIKPALIAAIEQNDLDIVKLLLANPEIDVNVRFENKIPYASQYEEKTPLCIAIEKGNIEIIKELLSSKNIHINSAQLINVEYPYEENDDPTSKTTSFALSLAINKGNSDIVKLLISHPQISIDDQTLEYVEYMSEMSSFHEYKMGGGWSYIMPLINQVMNYPDSDFHLQKEKNTPALCYAINKEQFEIAKIILSSDKCNVNNAITIRKYELDQDENDSSERSKWSWSPLAKTKIPALCIAVQKNNVETVKLLLSSPKIDVNAECLKESYYIEKEEKEEEEEENENENKKEINWIFEKKIESPLHIAVNNSNKEIILLLLKDERINLDQVDDKNKKAIDCAKDDEIRKLFQ